MMKTPLIVPVLKAPGSQGPGSHTTSIASRKTNPIVQSYFMPETLYNQITADVFEKSR